MKFLSNIFRFSINFDFFPQNLWLHEFFCPVSWQVPRSLRLFFNIDTMPVVLKSKKVHLEEEQIYMEGGPYIFLYALCSDQLVRKLIISLMCWNPKGCMGYEQGGWQVDTNRGTHIDNIFRYQLQSDALTRHYELSMHLEITLIF